MIKKFRYFFLGLTVGSGLQIPWLAYAMNHATTASAMAGFKAALIIQIITFVISMPSTLYGFLKK